MGRIRHAADGYLLSAVHIPFEDVGYLPRMAFNLDKPFELPRVRQTRRLQWRWALAAMPPALSAAVSSIRRASGCLPYSRTASSVQWALSDFDFPARRFFPRVILLCPRYADGCRMHLRSRHCRHVWRDTAFIRHGSVRGDVLLCVSELPPYRKPQLRKDPLSAAAYRKPIGTVLSLMTGRAAAVAAPAGLVLWLLGNFSVGNVSLLRYLSDDRSIGKFFGMDGVILLAFILGFPANETVIPIAMMIYMAEGALNRTLSAAAMSGILLANGWTGKTAACVIVFTLMHWPCSTTLPLHKKETGSRTWTALAAAADALRRCLLINLVFH